jgi:hypothetical protein
MKKLSIFFLIAFCIATIFQAAHAQMVPQAGSKYFHNPGNIAIQGNLSVGTTVPDTAAIVDFTSTTKGVKFPVMTTTQRNAISGPSEGLLVYNTTTDAVNVYTTSWRALNAHPTIYSAPTNGATVTLTEAAYNIINPAGTIAGATLTLPTVTADGAFVQIKFTRIVSTITWAGGQSPTQSPQFLPPEPSCY